MSTTDEAVVGRDPGPMSDTGAGAVRVGPTDRWCLSDADGRSSICPDEAARRKTMETRLYIRGNLGEEDKKIWISKKRRSERKCILMNR